jgi:hypothetical protein
MRADVRPRKRVQSRGRAGAVARLAPGLPWTQDFPPANPQARSRRRFRAVATRGARESLRARRKWTTFGRPTSGAGIEPERRIVRCGRGAAGRIGREEPDPIADVRAGSTDAGVHLRVPVASHTGETAVVHDGDSARDSRSCQEKEGSGTTFVDNRRTAQPRRRCRGGRAPHSGQRGSAGILEHLHEALAGVRRIECPPCESVGPVAPCTP